MYRFLPELAGYETDHTHSLGEEGDLVLHCDSAVLETGVCTPSLAVSMRCMSALEWPAPLLCLYNTLLLEIFPSVS